MRPRAPSPTSVSPIVAITDADAKTKDLSPLFFVAWLLCAEKLRRPLHGVVAEPDGAPPRATPVVHSPVLETADHV